MRWVRLVQQATSITSTARLVAPFCGRPVDHHPQGHQLVAAGQVAPLGRGADPADQGHLVAARLSAAASGLRRFVSWAASTAQRATARDSAGPQPVDRLATHAGMWTQNGRGEWHVEEHYFTADPATPFKRVPVRTNVWGHWLELTSGSGVFAQGRLDIGTGVLLREAGAAGRGARGPRPRLRVRRDRPGDRGRRARGAGHRRRRQRAGAAARPGERRADRGRRPVPRAFCPTRSTPRRRTTRSGPTRRSGSARRPCTSCCCSGCPGCAPRAGP